MTENKENWYLWQKKISEVNTEYHNKYKYNDDDKFISYINNNCNFIMNWRFLDADKMNNWHYTYHKKSYYKDFRFVYKINKCLHTDDYYTYEPNKCQPCAMRSRGHKFRDDPYHPHQLMIPSNYAFIGFHKVHKKYLEIDGSD